MGVNLPFEMTRGKPPTIAHQPFTGRITKVDGDGAWAVPIGGDMQVPIGPCRGGPFDELDVGRVCLVIFTQERPWAFLE